MLSPPFPPAYAEVQTLLASYFQFTIQDLLDTELHWVPQTSDK